MPELKSGIKTTEWIQTIVLTLLGIGVTFGVITQQESGEIQSSAKQIGEIIVALGGIVGALIVNIKYISARTTLKTEHERNNK